MVKQAKTLPKMLKPFVICLKFISQHQAIPELTGSSWRSIDAKAGFEKLNADQEAKGEKLLLIHVMPQQEV
jgi:hypothetical protein